MAQWWARPCLAGLALAIGLATGHLLALLIAATARDTPSIAQLAQAWGLRWALLLAAGCLVFGGWPHTALVLAGAALFLLATVGLAGGVGALLQHAGVVHLGSGFPHPARQAAAEVMLRVVDPAGLVLALTLPLFSSTPLSRRKPSSASVPISPHGGLVIVQNRETQFDAPLYARITREQPFPLLVVYTAQASADPPADPELGFAPAWDHLTSGAYPQICWRASSPWAILRLATQIQRRQPDLVIVCGYFPPAHLLLSLLLRLLGQPIGLRSDNTLQHTQRRGWRRRLQGKLVGAIQRLHHTWHPVGDQALAYLRALSGSDRPSFRFAYAADDRWFAAGASQARQERAGSLAARGWPADAFVLLAIVKWTGREDPLTLVKAFLQLHQAHPLARLILVGDGPLRPQVEALLAPVRSAAWLPGYVPYSRLPWFYGLASVFVHPCPDEPWGVSVNEALAAGLPVLAAAGVGAAAELLAAEQIVPNADATALAARLLRLARDPALGRRLSSAAGQRLAPYSYEYTMAEFQRAVAHGAGLLRRSRQ